MKESALPQYLFQMVESDFLHLNEHNFILVVNYKSRYKNIEKHYRPDAASIIKQIKHIF